MKNVLQHWARTARPNSVGNGVEISESTTTWFQRSLTLPMRQFAHPNCGAPASMPFSLGSTWYLALDFHGKHQTNVPVSSTKLRDVTDRIYRGPIQHHEAQVTQRRGAGSSKEATRLQYDKCIRTFSILGAVGASSTH